jgi:hypothetical protein
MAVPLDDAYGTLGANRGIARRLELALLNVRIAIRPTATNPAAHQRVSVLNPPA